MRFTTLTLFAAFIVSALGAAIPVPAVAVVRGTDGRGGYNGVDVVDSESGRGGYNGADSVDDTDGRGGYNKLA